MIVELNAGAESTVTEWRDFPAAGMRNFGDESADVKAFESPPQGVLLAAAVEGVAVVLVEQSTEVDIAKAAEFMFTA